MKNAIYAFVLLVAIGIMQGDDSLDVSLSGKICHGDCYSLISEGNIVYAGFGSGLIILSFDYSGEFAKLGECDAGGTVQGLCKKDSLIFVAADAGGVSVINVADPFYPVLIANHPEAKANDICISGNRLYVADRIDGLHIYNVTNPAEPLETATMNYPSYEIAVRDYFVYLASRYLRIIDVSDSTFPFQRSAYEVIGIVYGLALKGDRAYMDVYSYGLEVADISNPSRVRKSGCLRYQSSNDLFIVDTLLFACNDWYSFSVLNIAEPDTPVLCERFTGSYGGSEIYVDTFSGIALVASGMDLYSIDVSVPTDPIVLSSFRSISDYPLIACAGDYLAIIDNRNGMEIYNTADGVRSEKVSEMPELTGIYDMEIWSSPDDSFLCYLFLTCDSGIMIVDISDKTAPWVVTTFSTGRDVEKLYIERNHLYAIYDNRIDEYGITLSGVLESAGHYLNGYTEIYYFDEMAATSDYVYISTVYASSSYHYSVLRINKTTGALVSYLPTTGSDIFVWNNTLYRSVGDSLTMCTLDSAAAPSLVALYAGHSFEKMVFYDTLLYALDASSGLFVFNIADGLNPVVQDSFRLTTDSGTRIACNGTRVYVATQYSGVYIFDVTNRTGIENDYSAPVQENLCAVAYPNPFNSVCRIDLPKDTGLKIFDISGRSVFELSAGECRTIQWNPGGLASGIYCARFSNGKTVKKQNLLYLR